MAKEIPYKKQVMDCANRARQEYWRIFREEALVLSQIYGKNINDVNQDLARAASTLDVAAAGLGDAMLIPLITIAIDK